MYASIASAASFSSQNLSKFAGARPQPINNVAEKNTIMSRPTTTPPTSPNRLKPKEKLIGIYDNLLQVNSRRSQKSLKRRPGWGGGCYNTHSVLSTTHPLGAGGCTEIWHELLTGDILNLCQLVQLLGGGGHFLLEQLHNDMRQVV